MLTPECSNAETLYLYSVLVDQMLVHFYSEKMLFFRYCVREAITQSEVTYSTCMLLNFVGYNGYF